MEDFSDDGDEVVRSGPRTPRGEAVFGGVFVVSGDSGDWRDPGDGVGWVGERVSPLLLAGELPTRGGV